MTPRPHDALFRSAFEIPSAAAALLQALVSAEVRDTIAWESVRGESAAYVDPALADSHGDLLFSARLRIGGGLPSYLLLEHQSTEDPTMPLRIAAYQVRIWERWLKEHERTRLPPILSVVVNHAPGGWTTARSLGDMFEARVVDHPDVACLVPRYPLLIEDLALRPDADLQKMLLPPFQKLALWLLRDARDPARLLASFDGWVSTMLELLQDPSGRHTFAILVRYVSEVIDPIHWAAFHARIRRMTLPNNLLALARALDDTVYQKGRQEGLQEGRQEGLQEGRLAALRALINFKFKRVSLAPQHEARLQGATPEAVDRYLERVLVVDSLPAVFDD